MKNNLKEKEILCTGRGILLIALIVPHEEGDKVLIARDLLAKKLSKNGLKERDLIPFGQREHGVKFLNNEAAIRDLLDKIVEDVPTVAKFSDFLFDRGYFDDTNAAEFLEELDQLNPL